MRRVLGFVVVLVLIGGAVWMGLTSGGPRPLPRPTASPSSVAIDANRARAWPVSAQVEEGQKYIYQAGHCGLTHNLDFDGSFWRAINPNGTREPPSFFINADRGYITLVSHDEARYESSTGQVVELRRIDGPIIIPGCA